MKFRLPRDFDPAAYLTLNPDVKRSGKSAKIHYLRHGHAEGRAFRYTSEHRGVSEAARARKMDRLAPFLRTDMPFERLGLKLDFLSDELRQQTRIAETDNISANGYDGTVNALIEKHSAGLILDCGAGKRPIYHENVVNYEIVDYDSTDVIGVGEALPFADASFDAVISVAVLEHVRDPFKCAKEIIRVLKPGAIYTAAFHSCSRSTATRTTILTPRRKGFGPCLKRRWGASKSACRSQLTRFGRYRGYFGHGATTFR